MKKHPLNDLRSIVDFLDTRFQGPGGWRFGWDGILGLIPGVGDLVTNTFSGYVLFRAYQLQVPPSVLARMGLNIAIDNLWDAIPVIGNILDFFWRSNRKNLTLLENYLQAPQTTTRSSRWVLAATLAGVIILIVGCFTISVLLLVALVNWSLTMLN